MGSAILVLAAGWSIGIVLATIAPIPALALLVGAVASATAVWLAAAPPLRLAALALLACLVGQARVVLSPSPPTHDALAAYAGAVTVRGRLVEAPVQRGNRVEAVVEIERLAHQSDPDLATTFDDDSPRMLVRAMYARAGYGDRIEAVGRLVRPRSRPGYPLEQLLARRQIAWIVDATAVRVVEPSGASVLRTLNDVRGIFETNTRAVLPEPHASLVAGIVFGARVGLPADPRAAMSATGTSHLTAVSGANVAMVAGALVLLLVGLVGRAPASLLAIAGVWAYTLLVGAPPSALRAAAMASFALAAHGLGRESDAFAGLLLAVAALLGWDPGLAFDLGFQLSVAATAGLVLLSPSTERWLRWLPGPVRGQIAIAVAAQVSTLPLIVGTFQRISLVSLPANLLAAPVLVPIMALGTGIAFLGRFPGLDALLGWSAWFVAGLLLGVIQTAASLPGGTVAVGRLPAWLPAGWYLLLACWAALGSADARALGLSPVLLKRTIGVGSACMLVLTLAGWPGGSRDDGTQVVLFDTEPSSAMVRTASGRTVLLLSGGVSQGIVTSAGGELEFPESVVDLEIGPGGVRTGVDLLEIGVETAQIRADSPSDGEDGAPAPPVGGAATIPFEPGASIDVGDGVQVLAIDRRETGQRTLIDLAVVAHGLAILLPASGASGDRWSDVAPDLTTVAVLPSNGVTWARALQPRTWLAVVGDPPRSSMEPSILVPLLRQREYGAVRLWVRPGSVGVRAERCSGGRACEIELPTPARQPLAPQPVGSPGGDGPTPVQSGRAGAVADARRGAPGPRLGPVSRE
jgi:competence protein ComEC